MLQQYNCFTEPSLLANPVIKLSGFCVEIDTDEYNTIFDPKFIDFSNTKFFVIYQSNLNLDCKTTIYCFTWL